MYQNEVLKNLLDVIVLADKNGITLPVAVKECAKRMAWANLIWQKPGYREFMMGDSDDFDISPSMCRLAYCFHEPRFKWSACDKPDFSPA